MASSPSGVAPASSSAPAASYASGTTSSSGMGRSAAGDVEMSQIGIDVKDSAAARGPNDRGAHAHRPSNILLRPPTFHEMADDDEDDEVDEEEKQEQEAVQAREVPIEAFDTPEGALDLLTPVAVACSGGGVRSASFCAGGVFQLCMETGKLPAALSSVSGGGYLSSSLIHWARLHAQLRVPLRRWLPFFFGHFRRQIGYFVRDFSVSADDRVKDPAHDDNKEIKKMKKQEAAAAQGIAEDCEREDEFCTAGKSSRRDFLQSWDALLPSQRHYDRIRRMPTDVKLSERVLNTIRGVLSVMMRLPVMLILAGLVFIPSAFPFAVMLDTMVGEDMRADPSAVEWWTPLLGFALAALLLGVVAAAWDPLSKLLCKRAWILNSKISGFIRALATVSGLLTIVLVFTRILHALDQYDVSEWVLMTVAICWVGVGSFVSNALPAFLNNFAGGSLIALWFSHVTQWYVFRAGPASDAERIDDPVSVGSIVLHYYDIYSTTVGQLPGESQLTFESRAADGTPNKLEERGVGHTVMVVMFMLSVCSSLLFSLKERTLHRWYLHALRRAFYYRREVCGCGGDQCAVDTVSAAAAASVSTPQPLGSPSASSAAPNLFPDSGAPASEHQDAAVSDNCITRDLRAFNTMTFASTWEDLDCLSKCVMYLAAGLLRLLEGVKFVGSLLARTFCFCLFGESLSEWLTRMKTYASWKRYCDERLEDLHDWIVPGAPRGARQALPTYTVCTTVNAWQRAFQDAGSFEHAVLQEGRCWRMGDERAPDQDLGIINHLPETLAAPLVDQAPADMTPEKRAVFEMSCRARHPPTLPIPVVLPVPGSPHAGDPAQVTLAYPTDASIAVRTIASREERLRRTWTGERLKLSDAMAISAAAVSFGMGRFQSMIDKVRASSWQSMLGLSMGRTIWAGDRLSWPMMKGSLAPLLLQLTNAALLMWLAFDVILGGGSLKSYESKASARFGIVVAILCVTAAQLCLVCWLPSDYIGLFPILRAGSRFLGLQHHTSKVTSPAPRHLLLSDGGHSENLALLPLLRARQRVMVCMDGGADEEQKCEDLLMLLDDASRRWGIHFRPWTPQPKSVKKLADDKAKARKAAEAKAKERAATKAGGAGSVPASAATPSDASAAPVVQAPPPHGSPFPLQDPPVDLRAYIRTVWSPRDLYPRDASVLALPIEVLYPAVGSLPAERGLLVYLKPRPYRQETDPEHYTYRSLHGCCCVCCHGARRCACTTMCCQRFPHHSTANQFFTPEMHRWYRVQGMLAMTQATDIAGMWHAEQ